MDCNSDFNAKRVKFAFIWCVCVCMCVCVRVKRLTQGVTPLWLTPPFYLQSHLYTCTCTKLNHMQKHTINSIKVYQCDEFIMSVSFQTFPVICFPYVLILRPSIKIVCNKKCCEFMETNENSKTGEKKKLRRPKKIQKIC